MALATNQIHVWHFNESSGNAVDSINAMTLTNINTVTYGPGLLGNCAIATANDQTFNNTADALWTTGTPSALTVNVWLYVTSQPASGSEYVLTNTDGTTNPGSYRIRYQNNAGTLQMLWNMFDNTGSGSPTSILATQTLTTNTWMMWTSVWSGTTMTLYLNASSVGTNSLSTFGRNDPVSNFMRVMGQQGNSDTLIGKMDEYGVWTRALSGAEITSLYNGGAGFAYPYVSGPTNVKTVDGVAIASVKTMNGVAIGSIKSINGIT